MFSCKYIRRIYRRLNNSKRAGVAVWDEANPRFSGEDKKHIELEYFDRGIGEKGSEENRNDTIN